MFTEPSEDKEVCPNGTFLTGSDLGGALLLEADLNGADLSSANLHKAIINKADLGGADLTDTNLYHAMLMEAYLGGAILVAADLRGAYLDAANLWGADLSGASLRGASLTLAELLRADLTEADLTGADLTGTNLSRTTLVETILDEADLTGANIYGISVWKVSKDGLIQEGLVITPPGEPAITVDDLEIAQFIYLLLNNERIRNPEPLFAVAARKATILRRVACTLIVRAFVCIMLRRCTKSPSMELIDGSRPGLF